MCAPASPKSDHAPSNRIGYIAQWLERLTADQQVPGSNPGVPLRNIMEIIFLSPREACGIPWRCAERAHLLYPYSDSRSRERASSSSSSSRSSSSSFPRWLLLARCRCGCSRLFGTFEFRLLRVLAEGRFVHCATRISALARKRQVAYSALAHHCHPHVSYSAFPIGWHASRCERGNRVFSSPLSWKFSPRRASSVG